MMTPAVRATGTPRPLPMPSMAIPMVPEVCQEDPVAREMMEQIKSVASGKIAGLRMNRP